MDHIFHCIMSCFTTQVPNLKKVHILHTLYTSSSLLFFSIIFVSSIPYLVCSHHHKKTINIFWVAACDNIWNWHNKDIHEEAFVRPLCPSTYIPRIIMNQHQSLSLIRREPPQEGWVKLNSYEVRDGAGNAGCGGLIRGNAWEWLGGFVIRIGLCNVYLA